MPRDSGRIPFVEERVETATAGDYDILPAIAIEIGDADTHPDSHHEVRRRPVIAWSEVRLDMTIGQNVTFEMTLVDFVVEDEDRLERTDISAIMGQQLFAGDEFRLTVAIQIRQRHGVEGGVLGFDPVLHEAAFAVDDFLLEPG